MSNLRDAPHRETAVTISTTLRTAALVLDDLGLHTGDHFASNEGPLDISAAIFRAVTNRTPNCFLSDDDQAILLIQTNEPAMEAIRALSASLPTEPPTDPETGQDDHIEHLAWWASYAPDGLAVPTLTEVIGRLVRTADATVRFAAA